MVFVVIGITLGQRLLDVVDLPIGTGNLGLLAEMIVALVLFTDASANRSRAVESVRALVRREPFRPAVRGDGRPHRFAPPGPAATVVQRASPIRPITGWANRIRWSKPGSYGMNPFRSG